MRTILLSKFDEVYLQKCATELNGAKIAYGIIIGQQAEADKVIVVHLAKNSEEDVDLDASTEKGNTDPMSHTAQNIDDIDTQALSNQWLSACKMIPGSFSVLGVFVSAVEKNILDERTFKVAKQLLNDINSLLVQGKPFSGTTVESDCDYIFLVHSTSAKQTICKSFTHSSNGGSFTPMECRFVEKPFEWYTIDCNYELDELFPIVNGSEKINIEHEFQKSVEVVRQGLLASEIFLQNESVDDTLTLDAYVKKKVSSNNGAGGGGGGGTLQHQDKIGTCLRAAIFQPIKCQNTDEPQSFHIRHFNGTTRFLGVISSRIHCNPRNLIADVKRFIRNDIVRSLAARIQVYCDALTDPNISNEAMFISEPPRRVYFNLPNGSNTVNSVQLSEYIFRGEAPTVAVAQAKQVLDVDINSQHIIDDLEALPDDDLFNELNTQETKPNVTNIAKQSALPNFILIAGIFGAILALLISLALYFYLKS